MLHPSQTSRGVLLSASPTLYCRTEQPSANFCRSAHMMRHDTVSPAQCGPSATFAPVQCREPVRSVKARSRELMTVAGIHAAGHGCQPVCDAQIENVCCIPDIHRVPQPEAPRHKQAIKSSSLIASCILKVVCHLYLVCCHS